MIPSLSAAPAPAGTPAGSDSVLMEKARALETAFLSEMLSFTGLGEVSEAFGGGAGEQQFASFLRQEQAQLMVARGGIGLAEQIFNALKTRGGQRDGTA